MGKRRYTQQDYEAAVAAYQAWNPAQPGAPSVDELIAEHGNGMTKQALYNYMAKNGIPLKGLRYSASQAHDQRTETETVMALVKAITDCQMRKAELENYIAAQGLPLPV